MGDSEHSSQSTTAPERPAIALPKRPSPDSSPRAELAKAIPRRPRVSFWFGMVLALAFGLIATTAVTAERWLSGLGVGAVEQGRAAAITIRVAPFSGLETGEAHIGGGGIVIQRGAIATREQADNAQAVVAATPRGALPYAAFFVLAFVFAAIFTHHMRRSTKGRLLRVQIVALVGVAGLAIAVKVVMLATSVSILVVPVALMAIVPTMVLDRVVGLATGILAALVTSLLIPFDVSVAILLLVQAATAGLVVAEHPKSRWRAAISAGVVVTLLTAGTVVLLTYLTSGTFPRIDDPLRSPLVAAAIGPALATMLAVPMIPLFQLLCGEITQGKLIELEDLSHPLLKQIAEKSPGTWQHSLMMANMAEIAANAIGASGRLVRVGAYFHDLGKSLQPKYFIENLEPGETSPHDQLPPEVSCDAIFSHVTEGLLTARRAGLHERIIDFMHMHHGNGVLEYFWARCREQGNPNGFTVDNFRYPGHPPQSRETAILAICDAVEAASRTLKKPDAQSIDSLVQRIVYGKLHLGQLDESGLSMADLRRINDSLRETIRHANHGRIEYPWQKAQQDASATNASHVTGTQPRLDSLDRVPRRDTTTRPAIAAATAEDEAIVLDRPSQRHARASRSSGPNVQSAEALAETADIKRHAAGSSGDLAIVETAPALTRDSNDEITRRRPKTEPPPDGLGVRSRPKTVPPPEGIKIEFRKRGDTSQPPLNTTSTSSSSLPRPRTESELAATPRSRTESDRATGSGTALGRASTRDVEAASSGRFADARDIDPNIGRASSTRDDAGASRSSNPGASIDPGAPGRFAAHELRALDASGSHRADPSTGRASTRDLDPSMGRASTRDVDASGRVMREMDPNTTSGRVAREMDPNTTSGRVAREMDPNTTSGRVAREMDPSTTSGRVSTRDLDPNAIPGEARKRAATLPPISRNRAPTVQPPGIAPTNLVPPGLPTLPPGAVAAPSSTGSSPPPMGAPIDPFASPAVPAGTPSSSLPSVEPAVDAPPTRHSGPPQSVDLENAITNPPPLRRTMMPPMATRLPAYLAEDDLKITAPRMPITGAGPVSRDDIDLAITGERLPIHHVGPIEDAGRTEPSLPKVDLPLKPPPASDPRIALPDPGPTLHGDPLRKAVEIASRADAAGERDEWGFETPVVAPSKAELRALLGVPDVTREQSIDEIDRLHRHASEMQSDPEILPPPMIPEAQRSRGLPVTQEVDPDDIEASIDIAPQARRTAIGIIKLQKKPPPK